MYLLWDFDGTLAYRAAGGWTDTLLSILKQYMPDCAVTAEQIRPWTRNGFFWHTPECPHPHIVTAAAWWDTLDGQWIQAFETMGIATDMAHDLARQVRLVYPDPVYWQLYDDTRTTLDELNTCGWRHILLTNHVPELPTILTHLGLSQQIALVFNSAQTGYEKPHSQAFRQILDALPHSSRVCMIGDSWQADICGAQAVGLPAILVRKPHPQARYFCPDLKSLGQILESV